MSRLLTTPILWFFNVEMLQPDVGKDGLGKGLKSATAQVSVFRHSEMLSDRCKGHELEMFTQPVPNINSIRKTDRYLNEPKNKRCLLYYMHIARTPAPAWHSWSDVWFSSFHYDILYHTVLDHAPKNWKEHVFLRHTHNAASLTKDVDGGYHDYCGTSTYKLIKLD